MILKRSVVSLQDHPVTVKFAVVLQECVVPASASAVASLVFVPPSQEFVLTAQCPVASLKVFGVLLEHFALSFVEAVKYYVQSSQECVVLPKELGKSLNNCLLLPKDLGKHKLESARKVDNSVKHTVQPP